MCIEGGTVTIESAHYNQPEKVTPIPYAILQTGGELTLKNYDFDPIGSLASYYPDYIVQTEGGTLKISGGTFGKTFTGQIPLPFHVLESGSLIIDDGTFYNSISVEDGELTINGGTFYGLQSKNGKVTINGGDFNGSSYSISGQNINKPVIIEGGSLTITGGEFTATEYESVSAAIQIQAKAEVELSGGVYNDRAFHIDPSAGLTPESMLATGHGYFTLTQELQPDVQYKTMPYSTVTGMQVQGS